MMQTTTNSPMRVAHLPDWREGVQLSQQFQTTIQRSRAGLEQRSSRRKRPILTIEYRQTGLTPAEAKRRLDEIRAEFRTALTVPLWSDGIKLEADMTVATAATLAALPVEGEWIAPFDVWIWSREDGGEWRTCTAITGTGLVMSGTGTLYKAAAYCFPSRTMIREVADSMLSSIDAESGVEIHRYRTL